MSKIKRTGLVFTVTVVFIALIWFIPSMADLLAQEDHDHEEHADHNESSEHENHIEDSEHDDHESSDAHDAEGVIELSSEAMKMAGIEISKVTSGRISNSIELPGEVGFNEDRLVHIAPRFAGIAIDARFRVGDYVKAGALMAVIESNESMSAYDIKAPISGWVIKRHVSTGEFVSEQNSIYVIADLSNVWINLAVYPKDAEHVKPGLKTLIKAIGSNTEAEGVIEYVTPVIDINTRSITAQVILPNPNNKWRPGTFIQARVTTGYSEEGLLVEKSAVQVLDEENVVFISEEPGYFGPVPVVIGKRDNQFVMIRSGLEEGMEYVSQGAFELKAKIVTSSLSDHAGHGH